MKVVISYPHGDEQSSIFAGCLHRVLETTDMDLVRMPSFGATGRIHEIRNQAAAWFLDRTDGDALWMIDSDMAFPPWTLKALVDVMDVNERPVVGGLCFGQRTLRFTDAGYPDSEVYPTIYMWNPSLDVFQHVDDYPDDTLIRCAGTGAACLLIHRTVLESLREKVGDHWFSPVGGAGGDPLEFFSEDLSFCGRLMEHQIPLHVHTGIRTGHQKSRWLDHDMFRAQQSEPRPRWVVIPSKNNLDQLRPLIQELQAQGEADGIVVVDNGYGRTGRNWLSTAGVTVVECSGGIHEMWNAGRDEVWRHGPADVAFLNDDLKIGPDFLSGLQAGLADAVVVCPNYDGRDITAPVFTHEICANRYDGSGGVAGFAFMVRGDFLDDYRFPDDLQWWYGDNDLLLTAMVRGEQCAVLPSPTVEHLNGQTGDWGSPEMVAVTEKDREKFLTKWSPILS